MSIKKSVSVFIAAVSIAMISAVSVVCAEEGGKGSVSAPQAGNAVQAGMSKDALFKIYNRGDIRKFEKNGNEEVFVFDDILTSAPDDTITFYLVDDKVKSWDKNEVIFPTDEESRSAIRSGISKENLLKIYNIGNLTAYTRSGNKEVGTFYDILTSDSDDTITFYLVDGKVKSWKRSRVVFPTREELHKMFPLEKCKAYAKSGDTEAETFPNILTSGPDDTVTFYLIGGKVSSWELNTEASVARVRFIDETMAAAVLKARSEADARSKAVSAEADARSKAKAEADFKAMISSAETDLAARTRAMEERSRYNNYSQNYSTGVDDIVKAKQQNRISSVRSSNWSYNGGLCYRNNGRRYGGRY